MRSYFGIAAFNITGSISDSAFKLPVRSKLSTDLKGNVLGKLPNKLISTLFLIIYEFPVMGQLILVRIDKRCRQERIFPRTFLTTYLLFIF